MEFQEKRIFYRREKEFEIEYKGTILPHKFYADFVVFNSIILEVKSSSVIINNFVSTTVNYLKASGLQLGLIANFGEKSFTYKRVVF